MIAPKLSIFEILSAFIKRFEADKQTHWFCFKVNKSTNEKNIFPEIESIKVKHRKATKMSAIYTEDVDTP